MTSFCHTPRPKRETKKRPPLPPSPGLEKVPGRVVNDGKTIEWVHGGTATDLTPAEIAAIKRLTGCKTVKTFRAIRVKSLMQTRTVAQIAKELRCSERTVWGIRAALLRAGGGGK